MNYSTINTIVAFGNTQENKNPHENEEDKDQITKGVGGWSISYNGTDYAGRKGKDTVGSSKIVVSER